MKIKERTNIRYLTVCYIVSTYKMLTSSGPELAVFHQMASREGGRRGSRHAVSGPLSEHGVVPRATHMRAYEDGDGVHIKGVGAVPKGTPPPTAVPERPWSSAQCHPANGAHRREQTGPGSRGEN